MNKLNLLSTPARFAMRLVTTTALFLLVAAPVSAASLTVYLSPLSSVSAGSKGNSFDLLLTNTSGPSVSIAGFFFEVLASSADVTFTDATTATGIPYIFGSSSLFGPDIMGPGSTAQDLNASDLDIAGGISLGSGQTVGLGHVLFDVSPTAITQTVDFTFAGFPGTSLADELGNDVPITSLVGGRFTINGVTPVPEPSVLVLLLTVLPLIWAARNILEPRIIRIKVLESVKSA